MLKRVIHFLTDGVFQLHSEEVENRFLRWILKQYKLLYYTARGVIEHNTLMRSASLTFYTLMSIVPLAALIFAVMKGFGMAENLTRELHEALPQFPEFINYVVGFANNALARTRGGLLATFSVLALFWAVMQVFSSVESAFNNIWEVKRSRGFARQFSDYITVVVVVPVLWIASNAVAHYLDQWLNINASTFYHIWSNAASLALIWMMFTFVYIVLPNTKVRFSSAATAALVSGTIFLLFQWLYIYLQTWMSGYNAIYGSFAALPLFLIWLQTSWQIVLFGGELAFAYQNISKFEQERESLHISHDNRRKVLLATMLVIVRAFTSERGPISSEQVSHLLRLPVRIVRDVIFELEQAGLVLQVKGDENDKAAYYAPAKDVHQLTLYDVITAVETHGEESIDIFESEQVRSVSRQLDAIKEAAIHSPMNQLFIALDDKQVSNEESGNASRQTSEQQTSEQQTSGTTTATE